MDYNTFITMPIKALLHAVRGFMEEKDLEYRNSWEQTRFVGFMALSAAKPYMKTNPTITDILELPWDNEGKPEKRYKTPVVDKFEDVAEKWFPHLIEKDKKEEDGAERG